MSKRHFLIGICSLILATVLMFREERRLHVDSAPPVREVVQSEEKTEGPSVGRAELSVVPESPAEVRVGRPAGEEFSLENDFIELRVSSVGGGVRSVGLKKYAAALRSRERWVFNGEGHQDALSMRLAALAEDVDGRTFDLVARSEDLLLLRTNLDGNWILERSYRLNGRGSEGEPYLIHHEIRLIRVGNPDEGSVPSLQPAQRKVLLTLGSLPRSEGDVTGDHLNFSFYNGKRATFIGPRSFESSSGIFGLGRRSARRTIEGNGPIVWGAIKNQFFTAILTPSPGAEAFQAMPSTASGRKDMGGSLLVSMASQDDGYGVTMDYYVGPKEYARLDRLGQRQDLVMQFGWLGFISKLLLLMMTGIHRLIPNWGWTIICLTVLIKLLLWPLTNAQVRSTRGMARLQKPLKAIQEKYRSNPKKVQAETIRLFRENQINPAAGCLPIFIQIPIFLGLYFMLRTASELRFANFLWIRDLSVADTVGYWKGWPINPLPLVMGLTMFMQMQMTPNTMQNGTQKRIFQFMPLIFLFFCYRFPSGLVLYWTVQNVLTICQQWMINRRLVLEEAVKEKRERPRKRKSR